MSGYGLPLTLLAAIACQTQMPAPKPFSVLAPRATTLTAAQASNFAIGDFNGDGKPDVVAPAYLVVVGDEDTPQPGPTFMFLFLGNGDGTFDAPRAVIPLPNPFGYVHAGDFNGDGKLDLAFTNGGGETTGGTLYVALGHGDGTFSSPIAYATPVAPYDFFVADFNRDGKLDVVVNSLAQSPSGALLLGNGDGTFQSPLPISAFPYAVSDLNRDGIPDLVAYSTNEIIILLGRGDGTFVTSSTITNPPFNNTVGGYSDVAVGDVNGDGKPDLIVAQRTTGEVGAFLPANTAILLGNGDGTFKQPSFFVGPGEIVVVADLNQDGKLDLISNYSVMLGNGDGTFSGQVNLATPSYACSLVLSTIIPPTGRTYNCGNYYPMIQVADMNGDGLPDLVSLALMAPAGFYTVLTTYLNDSPGDGFLAVGVPATGQPTQVVGYPTNAIFGTQPVTVTAPLGFQLGENSLASGFGINLAPATEAATAVPYPTTLGGIRLHIGDSLAPLLYVSPTQINYLTPAGPYSGVYGGVAGPLFANPAVSVERVGSHYVAKGLAIPMATDAPSLFTVNSAGLAAATAVSVAADGTQTAIPVYDCSSGACVTVPVETHGDPVYLSLFGTGFDYVPSLGTPDRQVTCYGGTLLYLGPQGVFPGLYQINLKLPQATGTLGFRCELIELGRPPETYNSHLISNTVTILVK
jgi:uncharacterized protein (TIGR03437 family)